jgi:FkbM family methyltransferase
MSKAPFFKIVTINKNNALGLVATIRSVKSQSFTDYEFVVVDCQSDDDSVSVLIQHQHCIRAWCSEPDSGIYDAMNKGTRMGSRCHYYLYLNSGDLLYADYTLLVFNTLIISQSSLPDVAYGTTLLHDQEKPSNRVLFALNRPVSYCKINMPIHHQSIFFSYNAIISHGLVPYRDSLFRFAGDYDFFVRLYAQGANFKGWDFPVSVFNVNGTSYRNSTQDVIYSEISIVKHEILNRPTFWVRLDELVLRILNNSRRLGAYSAILRFFKDFLSVKFKRLLMISRKLCATAVYFPASLPKALVSVEHKSMLQGLKGSVNTVIDVGVNRGQFSLACLAYLKPKSIIGFEPLASEYAFASMILHTYSKDVIIRLFEFGLSSASSTRVFYRTLKSACSSYLAPSSSSPFTAMMKTIHAEELEFEALDQIWSNLEVFSDGNILLKIDTQGSEMDVLMGLENMLLSRRISFIYLELSDVEHYDGQTLFGEFVSYLLSYGFKLIDLANCSYDSDGRLSYCDALFGLQVQPLSWDH